MTGATHVAIAVSCGIAAGVPTPYLALLAGGALFPDMDTSRSTIGRIFFPISMPLSKWLGHRGPFHSFWLWGLVSILGMIWNPLRFVGIGAILHVLADCYTVSGVRAMAPWSSRLFVIFRRSWRIKTGSNSELFILLIAGTLAWAGHSVGQMGGISAMIGHIIGSPKIMKEEYLQKGLTKCYVKGKFRWLNGKTEKVHWLIIGMEGAGMAFQGKDRIIRTPKEGKFLRAHLEQTEDTWESARLLGLYRSESDCYFLADNLWHKASKGDIIFSYVIGDDLIISRNNEDLYSLD